MKAYVSFVDFLLYKLKGKSGTADFSTSDGLLRYQQRKEALEELRESGKRWRQLNDRLKEYQHVRQQAKTVLIPDMDKKIEHCVKTWHESDTYKKRIENFTKCHERCIKENRKPSKKEYNDAVAIVSTELSLGNGCRASAVGQIKVLDYAAKVKVKDVSMHD